jgi:CubicO group peptidase (beta-lactamase class C family)
MQFPTVRRAFETLVRTLPPDEVTTRGAEVDPRDGGLAREDVEAIWDAAVGAYETGLYPALQVCVRRRGQVVLDRAIGHLRGNAPDDPRDAHRELATPRTLFNLFSASKAVTAMLVHLLDERHLLHLDDPVAHYLPELGKHGKHRITLRHVLTHRAGIPQIPPELVDVSLLSRPREILQLLADSKPRHYAGRKLAYHALTGGFVLGAVIERVTGKDPRAFLRDEIARPLGFDAFGFGVPPHRLREVAVNAFTGPPLVPPFSTLIKRALSVEIHEAVRLTNDPRFLDAIVPAGNICASANEASRFMQLLLDGGTLDGVRVFDPRTIRRAIAEDSYLEVDLTLGLPIRYSMGFMLGARVASLYGLETTRAFGHLGFTNIMMWADPERDVAVAVMTSGKPVLSAGLLRTLWLPQVIARRCPRDWGGGRDSCLRGDASRRVVG